jgi:hypothetical protein
MPEGELPIEELVNTTMTKYVQPTLAKCLTTTYTFHLWMSKGAHDIFAVVINFLSTNWEPNHIIIGLFEVDDMSGTTMVVKFKHIFDKFALMHKIMAYIKDEGSNL